MKTTRLEPEVLAAQQSGELEAPSPNEVMSELNFKLAQKMLNSLDEKDRKNLRIALSARLLQTIFLEQLKIAVFAPRTRKDRKKWVEYIMSHAEPEP